MSLTAAPGPQPQPAWRALQPRAPAGTAAGLALRSRLRAGLGAKLSRRKPLVRGRRTISPAQKLCAPSPPQPRPTENMAPWNVVPRSPPGIPKCPSPGPRLPAGAKSQLVRPQKERAPLVQCDTESKPCSRALGGRCPRPSASDQQFLVTKLPSKGESWNRQVQESGLGKGLGTSGLSLPEAWPETCLQSGAGVGAASAGMKPFRPRQLSWHGGPVGAEGTLQAGEAAFQSPVTGNPAGAPEPEGTGCPRPGTRSGAPAARLFANRCARVECSETYMCSRQVH